MKTFSIYSALIGCVLVFPISAFGAGLSFSPDTISVKEGDVFSVGLIVSPENSTAYSVRGNIAFDPEYVQATAFSFSNNWMRISQPGYDIIDNTKGLIIKTAGYPGGIKSSTSFGRITFKAVKTGTTTLSLTGDSMVLDSESRNQLSGSSKTSISITKPASLKAETSSSRTETPTKKTKTSIAVPSSSLATTSETVATTSLIASVNEAITLGTGSPLVSALLSAIVVLLAGGAVLFLRNRRL